MALLRTDPDYVTCASSNHAHFLLPRTDLDMQLLALVRFAVGPNADLNALATYLRYHLWALATAIRMSRGGFTP
jgi:hypothetical protein